MVKPSQQFSNKNVGKSELQQGNQQKARSAELSRIRELSRLNRIDEAFEALNIILKQRPNNVRANLILGTLLQKKNDFSAAIEVYKKIIRKNPQKIQAYQELAKCFQKIGSNKEAISTLEQVQSFESKDLELLQKLGELYSQEQDRPKALKYYQKAVELAPKDLWANLNLAIALRDSGLYKEAEEQLHKTELYHPENLNVLLEFGQLEKKRHRLNLALDYFQQAQNKYPESLETHFSLIDVLYNLGRGKEAQNILNRLGEQYPNHPGVLIHLGHLNKKQGQREKALSWFSLAEVKNTNITRKLKTRTLIVEELKELGRLEEAIEIIDETLAQFPSNINFQILKGHIFQKQLAFAEAAKIYHQILETDQNHLNARMELARTYSYLGKVKKAIQLLEDTQELVDSNVRIIMLLGSLARALGDLDKAYDYYQKACNLEPYNLNSHCALANLMFLQGDMESAVEFMKETQARMPYGEKISLKLSQLYMRSGEFDLSHNSLENVAHRFPDDVALLCQLSRIYSAQGNYEAAWNILEGITTDNQDWIQEIEELRANIAFHQYDYEKAEYHLNRAISYSSLPIKERIRLASVLMLTYRIEQGREQLKLATTELNLKTPVGKSIVPLTSHGAMVINGFRINPLLMEQLQATDKLKGHDKLIAIGEIVAQDAAYLGGAIYLTKELRSQEIFAKIRDNLPINRSNIPTIPRRIVQFWDDPEPPESVQRICQSWIDCNPQYEYIRFSLKSAIAFLKEHYDKRVLQAFARCKQVATQADLFRLAYLNKMGGFYADADDLCQKSLDKLLKPNPELVVLQEDLACLGNNFLGCVPGQEMIKYAFEQAVNNLLEYYNDSPWFGTGPGLVTCAVSHGLLPYLKYEDYRMYPPIWVLSQSELKDVVTPHILLPYKRTEKSWHYDTYRRWIRQSNESD